MLVDKANEDSVYLSHTITHPITWRGKVKKAILTKFFMQSQKASAAQMSARDLIAKLNMVIDISTYILNTQCQNSGDKVLH